MVRSTKRDEELGDEVLAGADEEEAVGWRGEEGITHGDGAARRGLPTRVAKLASSRIEVVVVIGVVKRVVAVH
jgi:hypothetical protein